MQIRKDAMAKTEKFLSLKSAKASAGKMLLSLNPPEPEDRSGGVCGNVKQYSAIRIEAAPARRMGTAVDSTRRKPMSNPAKDPAGVPRTRNGPKSFLGSFIWRKERELVSAIVGM